MPICQFGESVYACVDCSDPEGPVVCLDLTGFESGTDLKALMVPQRPSVLSWLAAWAEGIDLWQELCPLDLD